MTLPTSPKRAPAAALRAPLPPQAISAEVLKEKYAKGDETTPLEVHRRVARALAEAEAPEQRALWEERFLQALQQGFIPAGRIQSAAGTGLAATLINCFVQPVGDSITQVDDGHPGIYTALAEAAETMRRGGGVGYDFSRIRPRGAWVGAHAERGLGAGELHARLRPVLRDGGIGRRAARRADGGAALRPPRRRGVHPRQGRRRPEELQHLGRRHRRLHAGRARRRRRRTGAPRRARRRRRRPPAPGSAPAPRATRRVGLPQAAGARAVGADHALHLRPRRARRAVPGHHQPRQQPGVLRDDRGDESLR